MVNYQDFSMVLSGASLSSLELNLCLWLVLVYNLFVHQI